MSEQGVPSPYVVVGTDATFNEIVIEASSRAPVLVDFWAPWCGPCRTLTPLLEALAAEGAGAFTLVKVNTDENPGLAQHFNIRSIPTVMAVKNGQIVEEFMGAQTRPYIEALLARLGATEGAEQEEDIVSEARRLFEAGSTEEAIDAYRRALAQGSSETEVLLGLGRALLEMAAFDDAESTLKEIELGETGFDEAQGLLGVVGLHRLAAESPERSALGASLEADPGDHGARYALAARCFAVGEVEAALDALLEIVRRDRAWQEEAARKAMLAIFQAIGNRSPLSDAYRTKLSRTLY